MFFVKLPQTLFYIFYTSTTNTLSRKVLLHFDNPQSTAVDVAINTDRNLIAENVTENEVVAFFFCKCVTRF